MSYQFCDIGDSYVPGIWGSFRSQRLIQYVVYRVQVAE
jgi:hypothetical protein